MDLAFLATTESDADTLADTRTAAMRESLERIGRFDSLTALWKLRHSWFQPALISWPALLDTIRPD
ncbi:hypothetical protein J2801_005405, partial [Paraburkholderia phenoliruptrix]|nr:hypothetical protein [Paraburkholderia phenoliruptrix]